LFAAHNGIAAKSRELPLQRARAAAARSRIANAPQVASGPQYVAVNEHPRPLDWCGNPCDALPIRDM